MKHKTHVETCNCRFKTHKTMIETGIGTIGRALVIPRVAALKQRQRELKRYTVSGKHAHAGIESERNASQSGVCALLSTSRPVVVLVESGLSVNASIKKSAINLPTKSGRY